MLSMYVAAEQKRNPESNLPYRSNEFDVCIHNPEIDFLHPMAQKHLIGPNCGPGRNENIDACTRVRPRFFDQVGHQTTNASIGNKYFFTK